MSGITLTKPSSVRVSFSRDFFFETSLESGFQLDYTLFVELNFYLSHIHIRW